MKINLKNKNKKSVKVNLGGNLGFIAKMIDKIQNSDKKGSAAAETLSYKQLHKTIVTLHPTDPETFESMSIMDSVSVNKYGLKLVDALGCLFCLNKSKEFKLWLK